MYLGVNFLRGIDFFSSTNRYYVYYKNIDGLTVSNPVLVNGYTVGRVNKIMIDQEHENRLLVEFDIDKELVLGKNSKALLISSDLLGSKAIDLKIGKVTTPLASGDTIRGEITVPLTEMIEKKVLPITDKLYNISSQMEEFMDEEGDLRQMMKKLNSASNDFKGILSDNRDNLKVTTDKLAEISTSLADPENGLEPLVSKMNHVADSVKEMRLAQISANLDKVLTNLNVTLEGLNEGKGTLGQLTQNDSLYNSMNLATAELALLLEDLRENPRRYVHFSLFGRKEKEEPVSANKED
nr:MlaD family protein [Xanthovirga aplysinae]